MSLPVKLNRRHFQPRACTARRKDKFGVNFNVVILVENNVVQPGKEITGKILLNVGTPLQCSEMLLQLEVFFTFPVAQNMIGSMPGLRQSILGIQKPGQGGYQESPVKIVILKESATSVHTISGVEAFKFKLAVPGNITLPRPFDIKGYSLLHRLAVYMKAVKGSYVEVAEKVMKCNGYNNLLYNVEMEKSSMAKAQFGSLYSGATWAKATLTLQSCRYIPGESVPFVLHVTSKKMIGMELSVCGSLFAKVREKDEALYPYSLTKFESKKISLVPGDLKRGSFTWKDEWKIPFDIAPSFHDHPMLEICHCLQFQVAFKTVFTRPMSGSAPICVGTTRDPPGVQGNSYRSSFLNIPGNERERRARSHSSGRRATAGSLLGLPPAYSQLSLRAQSLEILPPAYDKLLSATEN